jgi:hypothetical protein
LQICFSVIATRRTSFFKGVFTLLVALKCKNLLKALLRPIIVLNVVASVLNIFKDSYASGLVIVVVVIVVVAAVVVIIAIVAVVAVAVVIVIVIALFLVTLFAIALLKIA